MFPVVRSHSDYQSFVINNLKSLCQDGSYKPSASDISLLEKFWISDLSSTFSFVQNSFSPSTRGATPHDPADLLRSYLLSLSVKSLSIDNWVDALRRTPIFAIISGFSPGSTPGVGTFYDFFSRLWDSDSPNLTPHVKPKPRKTPKGKKKGDKAPTTSTPKVASLINRILKYPPSSNPLPTDTLFNVFYSLFLVPSASAGLLGDMSALSLAGDGTPIKTASFTRSKKICDCVKNGIPHCECHRSFSQPDCNIGWDSSRERFFSGYHLYRFTASDSFHDLPVFFRLHPASRHDSMSLIISYDEFRMRFPLLNVDKILLDAAHDAMPIYKYFDSFGINTFIDLNKRSTGNTVFKDTFSLSPDGIPVCSKDLLMKDNGLDKKRGRRKFRCPLVKDNICCCDTPCSTSPYGRCVYTFSKDNLRMFPSVVRGSKEWDNIYKRRTSAERSNKREKVDYLLESANHRSTKMWYVRTYGIMMCQHMDAWLAEFDVDFKEILAA